MHTRIYRLTLAALVGLAVPAAAPEYEASDYLPLAVGNSWTFQHMVHDRAVFMSDAGEALLSHMILFSGHVPAIQLGMAVGIMTARSTSEWSISGLSCSSFDGYVGTVAGKVPLS